MSTLSLRKIKHDSSSVDNITLDSNGQVGILATPTAPLTVGRVNSANEGGQIDLCRSTDNASSWGIDVYGGTSTPSLRIIDNVAAAVRLQIDGSGRVSVPNVPSFRAIRSGTMTGTSDNPVQYDVIDFNNGGYYNNSTYRFTTPIAGKYLFTAQFSFYVPGDARQVEVGLKVNGSTIQGGDCFMQLTQGNNTHTTATITAVLNLAAGDYVQGAWVSSTASITFYSSTSRNCISGYLIG